VQMGATISHLIGRAFRRNVGDCRALLAAGAGAGLAAAFNAPLAGSAFVLEELLRRFEMRNAIAALGASGSAIVVARLITGPAPDFTVAAVSNPALCDNLLCFLLGITAGLLGAIYNRALFSALAIADRLACWPAEARAAMIGAAAGALAWFAPGLAGGGDALTQRVLDGTEALALLPLIFALRLILGAASYAAGTPGGLFAPLLSLGAQMGFVFGGLFDPAHPGAASHAASFAIVGMAALFTAVVRAPLTGMILVTEMTANSILLLPMLAACFSSMAMAIILRQPPVYDALKERVIAHRREKPSSQPERRLIQNPVYRKIGTKHQSFPPAGRCRARHHPACSASISALRHENRIDDVNDAIPLVDVGDRHEGFAALGVDNFKSAAVLAHG
jgi:CIC family chloride channel protein